MTTKKHLFLLSLVGGLLPFGAGAAAEPAGNPCATNAAAAFVFLRPETSSFWRTATNASLRLPTCFPPGARSAVLTVTGAYGYRKVYGPVTGDFVEIRLPPASSPQTEDVYTLSLVYDTALERTARLALVEGTGRVQGGSTRCLSPADTASWRAVRKRAVVPVPYGTTALTVDGVALETGLAGAQGWAALPRFAGGSVNEVGVETNGVPMASATLREVVEGGRVIVR
jgi:hypothetical protein